MADDKKYYYMRLKEDFFDNNDAVKIMESMPDGYLYSNILLKLYLKSLKCNGRLMYNDRIPYNAEVLATLTGHNVGVVEKALDVFEKLGIRSGIVFNYHQDRREARDYLKDLELLQYDMLYGENYIYGGKENAYARDESDVFQMGILDVHIYEMQTNLDGTYSFYGDNMTASSKIYVNGEKQTTKFLNNARIELMDYELQEGDTIVVSQVGSSNRVFRSTEEYRYNEGKLVLASEYVAPVEENSEVPVEAVEE